MNAILHPPPELAALRFFGSHVRGDATAGSDRDILAVVNTGSAEFRTGITDALRLQFRDSDVSVYSASTITRMFSTGHLFAWHLFRESVSVSPTSKDLIDVLGQPAPYRSAAEDIAALRAILDSVPSNVQRFPQRATYEAGLVYVCCRNIALSASWFSVERPDFSRHSPFHLRSKAMEFPLTRTEYDLCVTARLAGTRGLTPSPMSSRAIFAIASKAAVWAARVARAVGEP